MPDPATEINEAISGLKSLHSGRDIKLAEWKALRRGFDPRQSNPRTRTRKLEDSRLNTNDPVTYFDLVVHMLAGTPVKWRLASKSGDSDTQIRENRNAEEFVTAILDQNDERLMRTGMPRMERAVAESLAETGRLVVNRESSTSRGNLTFRVDIVNPGTVYERFDQHGLAEFAREFRMNLKDLEQQAQFEPTWDQSVFQGLRDKYPRRVKSNVKDYWIRVITPGGMLVRNGILVDDQPLKPIQVDDNADDGIPYDVFYANGETFPEEIFHNVSENDWYVAKSILEPNISTYLEKHEFLKKLRTHMDEVLTSPIQELTVGGQPRMDPDAIDPNNDERHIQAYDSARGERGASHVGMNPLDASTNLYFQDLDGQLQRGSVPHLLHGNIGLHLSGFAISQIMEAALAAVGEIAVVMERFYGNLGHWILETFKESNVKSKEVHGFIARTGRRSYFFRDVKPSDIPKRTRIMAEKRLSMPSDLTERIANARQLDPSGRPIVTRRTIYEELIPDVVPDVQREIDDLQEQELSGLNEIQLLEVLQSLRHRAKKAEADNDDIAQAVIAETIQDLKGMLNRSGTQPNNEASGVPPQGAISTEQRTRGVPQEGRRAPQQGGPPGGRR